MPDTSTTESHGGNREEQLLAQAMALPIQEREAFVRRVATDDTQLRDAVLHLLASTESPTLVAPTDTPWTERADGSDSDHRPPSTATDDLIRRLAEAPKLDVTRYEIEGEVDRGGMGVILKIRDCHLNRPLAMKVMLDRKEPTDDYERQLSRQFLSRFLEEAQVTSQLDHPGVVPVHELGLDQEGKVFFTMRLIHGRTAGEVFAQAHSGNNGWTTMRALEVVLKVCDTMAFAHDKGILHRDLKPDNVMVGRFGEVYVMDWGLAKVVGQDEPHDQVDRPEGRSAPSRIESARRRDADSDDGSSVASMDGQRVGTPSYMPPEQARGEVVDQRADVYAIGAMLYELLAGRAPYVTPGARQPACNILSDVVDRPPKPLTEIQKALPAALVAIVDKAMARQRGDRYTTTQELAADIRAFLDQRAVQAYRTGALIELRLWIKRNKPLATTLMAAVLFLVAGIAGTLINAREANRQAQANAELATAETKAKEDAIAQKARADELATTATKAKEKFATKVVEFDQLASVVRYERAVASEQLLYPAWPNQIDALQRWLDEDCTPLLAMRPRIDSTVTTLRANYTTEPSEAQRQLDLSSHPRHLEWQQLEKRIASLHYAAAIRTGQAELVELELPAGTKQLAPDMHYQLGRMLGSPRPKALRLYAQEPLALALARLAVQEAIGTNQEAKYRDSLAWALLANGQDEAAKEQSAMAVKVADASVREIFKSDGQKLVDAVDRAGVILVEAEASYRLLDTEVRAQHTWTFPAEYESERFLHGTLVDVQEKLAHLESEQQASVLMRLRWARQIGDWTRAHPNARITWTAVREQIAASNKYAGHTVELREENVYGLVPLGANPVTGYQEFYHLRSAWDGVVDPSTLPIPRHAADGSIKVTDNTGIVFVLLPGGTVQIGSQNSDPDAPYYDPQRESEEVLFDVTLSPFLLARHEMTQAQWQRLWTWDQLLRNPSSHQAGGRIAGKAFTSTNPTESVDWVSCDLLLTRVGLVLPTEAQWEYGCRAGTTTPWSSGREASSLEGRSNLADASAKRIATWQSFVDWDDGYVSHSPVGSFAANGFGLFDMHGNVSEWCRDRDGDYGRERPGDGLRGPKGVQDDRRDGNIMRGGSFSSDENRARSARRNHFDRTTRGNSLGLRAARSLQP
ncbi:MAG: formylglycine-generating enzyme required for sulfatase activity/serine/threonine protein kinase [Planctomycetota bacterium]|jgi:formylglycine-generating enzyme required for sulfatase activity/serine/threonine protein kinase